MRVLVFGHQSHTGFGIVTEQIGGRLVGLGQDVRVLAVNHRGEPVRGPLAGRVWPTAMFGDSHGGNLSSAAIDGSLWRRLDPTDDWRPDVVLAIADVSGLMGHIGRQVSEAWQTVPVFHYCPIEGDNLAPSWRDLWKIVRPVAMSDYGQRMIEAHIGSPVPRIYHGVDTETFRAVSLANPVRYEGKLVRTKEEAKAAVGLDPTRKVIFRSDRLVERKFYDLLIASMVPVFEAVPDADLVIHCSPVDDGLNLYEEIARLPKQYWPRVKLTKAHDTWRGLATEDFVALLNAADVYVSTTGGEGFGLNLAEALACQVPVVVTDWAAEREVVGDGGILVPPLRDAYGEVVRYHSKYGMDWAVPDARAFAEPVITLLTRKSKRTSLGAAGRLHVKRSFSWDEAAVAFLGLFENAALAAAA